MTRTPSAPPWEGERPLLVLRRHWWLLARPLLPLALLLSLLPMYAGIEYLLPVADLSQYETLFLGCDFALIGLALLKWLAADLTPWLTERCMLTNRRVIVVRGVLIQERRELGLHQVGETIHAVTGAQGRFFHFGDLTIQSTGPGSPLVFRSISQPRKVQGVLAAHARAARVEHVRGQNQTTAISAALERIFQGSGSEADAPTLEVNPVTSLTARAQRRLNLLPREVVLAATRRHLLNLCGRLGIGFVLASAFAIPTWLLFPAMLFAVATVAAIILGLWSFGSIWAWNNVLCVLTTARVVEIRCSRLAPVMRQEIPLGSVRDIAVRRVVAGGRIWRVGALALETTDHGMHLLRALPNPDAFHSRLLITLEAARRHQTFQEQERLAATLTDWFEEYHRLQVGR
ncbi:MAG TPA: PH domain-containing protein [Chloroflexota bacterium]|nr:PH domain-containing protein [Chloroflexota bacterium]